jgi:hypothetical protein
MKVNIEIEDSDISELLWDRMTSYGEEPDEKEFEKILEKHKEELRNILQVEMESNIGSIYDAGEAFEFFIEDNGLNEDKEDSEELKGVVCIWSSCDNEATKKSNNGGVYCDEHYFEDIPNPEDYE